MSVIERTEVVTVAIRGDEVPADGVATYSAVLRNGGPGAPARLTVPFVDGRPDGPRPGAERRGEQRCPRLPPSRARRRAA